MGSFHLLNRVFYKAKVLNFDEQQFINFFTLVDHAFVI